MNDVIIGVGDRREYAHGRNKVNRLNLNNCRFLNDLSQAAMKLSLIFISE